MATMEETRRYMLIYYVGLSTIYWYDWIVTIPKEYRKIWKSKWTLVKINYLINRYAMLILTIFILQGFRLDWSNVKCRKYIFGWQNALPLIVQASIGFMLMLRCYAIWGRSKIILAVLMSLQAIHMGVTCFLSIEYVKVMEFPDGNGPCIPYNSRPALTWGCILALIYDLTATFLVLWKSLQIKSQMTNVRQTVLITIIKHGFLYALGTSLIVTANMAFLSRQYDTPFRGYLGGNLCTYLNTIIMCRLALSLKRDAPSPRSKDPLAASITGFAASRLPKGFGNGAGSGEGYTSDGFEGTDGTSRSGGGLWSPTSGSAGGTTCVDEKSGASSGNSKGGGRKAPPPHLRWNSKRSKSEKGVYVAELPRLPKSPLLSPATSPRSPMSAAPHSPREGGFGRIVGLGAGGVVSAGMSQRDFDKAVDIELDYMPEVDVHVPHATQAGQLDSVVEDELDLDVDDEKDRGRKSEADLEKGVRK